MPDKKEPIIFSKLTLRLENSDDTHSELTCIVPKKVATQIVWAIEDWQEHWYIKVSEMRRYLDGLKRYEKKLLLKK